MAAIPIAPFPPSNVWKQVAPDEWDACLDAWIILAEFALQLDQVSFNSTIGQDPSLATFLGSYFHEMAISYALKSYQESPKAKSLRRICFLLVHRTLSEVSSLPPELSTWSFLADLCEVFPRSDFLRTLLSKVWDRREEVIVSELQKVKLSLINTLEKLHDHTGISEKLLKRLCALLHTLPKAGVFFMTGSDFIDCLTSTYAMASPSIRSNIVALTYLGLSSIMSGKKPNFSLLYDHLYNLKAATQPLKLKGGAEKSLLVDLVSETSFLSKLRNLSSSTAENRLQASLLLLEQIEVPKSSRRKRRIAPTSAKGKQSIGEPYGHNAVAPIHVHKWSLISQIQDLFPDLGSGFVLKLLDEYRDDVEAVTANLLEDTLPDSLARADRKEEITNKGHNTTPHLDVGSIAVHSAPERRNIFDNDDFDQLNVDISRLHIGHRDGTKTADQLLSDRTTAPNKAAILSALAAFDSDDDEHDDTYDVDDVGGTVDTALPGNDEVEASLRDVNEEALFRAYKLSPEVFGRDSTTRRSKPRLALRKETGLTDEAIEGWSLMLSRDQRKLRRLEAKFAVSAGAQTELPRTAYQANTLEGADSSDGQDGGAGRGGYRGRGRGTHRGGRGSRGNVAGPANERDTQVSRQRKEANKSSRANHNRKGQHARKMARGGFPG